MGTPLVSWASALYAAALLLFLVSYFIIYPFVEYIRDPKGKKAPMPKYDDGQPVN